MVTEPVNEQFLGFCQQFFVRALLGQLLSQSLHLAPEVLVMLLVLG